VLYICIPTHDEAPTVGVLLWRIRKVFQEYTREYEILVYDDGSTDDTREVLEPYAKALPLSVLGTAKRVGYAQAVEALLREAANRTRYPRRDAVILMQADFTDRPEEIPELVKRFEGGADVVVADRSLPDDAPEEVRKLHKYVGWIPKLWPLRNAVTIPGVKDPWSSMRLLRIATVRDLLRVVDKTPLPAAATTWQANLDLLVAAQPHARRIESVPVTLRYDLRPRESRREAWPDAWGMAKAAWAARRRKLAPPAVAAALPTRQQPPAAP
jgi:glycosyltransferase involved in cell wall biosynthesis